MRNNIIVTGANGQLGSTIKKRHTDYKKYNFFFFTSKELDITNYKELLSCFKELDPYAIINCAAYTAVDKAESDFIKADDVNNKGVKSIAELAKEYSVKLIHFSTDYVFDGTNYKPYLESDKTSPRSIYWSSKLK